MMVAGGRGLVSSAVVMAVSMSGRVVARMRVGPVRAGVVMMSAMMGVSLGLVAVPKDAVAESTE